MGGLSRVAFVCQMRKSLPWSTRACCELLACVSGVVRSRVLVKNAFRLHE